MLQERGIAIWYDVIIDNPFETLEEQLETVETLIQMPKPSYPQLFSLVFYEGTAIYDRALEECPEYLNDFTRKDYYEYDRRSINDMIEVATTLHAPLMRRLLVAYRRGPERRSTRLVLFGAKVYSRLVLRPITYFRVIQISQGGSVLKTLGALSSYFRVGFSVYFNLFHAVFRRS